MLEKTTNLGEIRFSKNVIERIASDAAECCNNNVSIFNYKGKYKPAMPGTNIIFSQIDNRVEITVHIVVKFGASIGNCSRTMLNYMYENIEKVMGVRPDMIKIVVTGVQSKEIARRHIVIKE